MNARFKLNPGHARYASVTIVNCPSVWQMAVMAANATNPNPIQSATIIPATVMNCQRLLRMVCNSQRWQPVSTPLKAPKAVCAANMNPRQNTDFCVTEIYSSECVPYQYGSDKTAPNVPTKMTSAAMTSAKVAELTTRLI